jgi:hypothetical protein
VTVSCSYDVVRDETGDITGEGVCARPPVTRGGPKWRLGVGFVSRVGMWGKMDRARLLVRSREFRWLKTDIASSDAVKKRCILKFKNVKWSAFSGHVNILRAQGVLKQVSERRILFPMVDSTLLLPSFLRPDFPSTFPFGITFNIHPQLRSLKAFVFCFSIIVRPRDVCFRYASHLPVTFKCFLETRMTPH